MSGTLGTITRTISGVTGTVRAIGVLATSARAAGSLITGAVPFTTDAGGGGGVAADFLALLQPASWRGQPFAVIGSRLRAGRRKAVHEYPFRDGAWIEDLGKRGRVYGFEGFLIGDDAGEQMQAFIVGIEQAGPGELVHPTFGARQVEVLDFDAGEEWDAGRVWRFRVEFLEGVPRSLQLQPSAQVSTKAGVASAADAAEAATSDSFLTRVGKSLASAYSMGKQAIAAVKPYVIAAVRLASDASRVVGMVSSLSGNFGRYGSGHASPIGGVTGVLSTVSQVTGAVRGVIGAATASRNLVVSTSTTLSTLAGP